MEASPSATNSLPRIAPVENARFARLYDQHGDMVFRLSLRLCGGCVADAEDLAQDALIAAFQGFPRFAGRARVTTWLYTVTVRAWQKRRAREDPETLPLREEDHARLSLAVGREDVLSAHLTRLTIDAAISGLPDTLREAFVLVKCEELTHREAARVLGLPQGTIQARVHEAARRLRVAIGGE